MTSTRSSRMKLAFTWLIAIAIRFIPFRPPNFEPVLASLMPVSKKYGAVASFAFAFLSIAAYDLVTSGLGEWTYVTAFAYGAVGLASALYFKNRAGSRMNFLAFGVFGTLAYDALTGLTIGPIFHHQAFVAALAGQIPFTLSHLAGTVAFSLVLSPALFRWLETDDLFAPASALVRSRT